MKRDVMFGGCKQIDINLTKYKLEIENEVLMYYSRFQGEETKTFHKEDGDSFKISFVLRILDKFKLTKYGKK